MKVTTRIIDILQAEYIDAGENEFWNGTGNDQQLSMFSGEWAFIRRAMRYDDPLTKQLVTNIFFQGFTLETPEADDHFKKSFINMFLTRQIAQQTVEAFSSRLLQVVCLHEDYINVAYTSARKFMTGGSDTEAHGTSKSTADNRNLSTTLPQDNINLNVDNTQLDYGDQNNISRNKATQETSNTTTGNSYNIDAYLKTFGIFDLLFNEIDKQCFLHVW